MQTGKHSYTLTDPNHSSRICVLLKKRAFYVEGAPIENITFPLRANAQGGCSVMWGGRDDHSIAWRLALLVAGWPENWPDQHPPAA